MQSNFSRLVRRIRDTQPEEIDCSACLDHLSQYVDLELGTGSAAAQLPLVKQHIEQCGVCFEEYVLLRDLARLEQDGRAPSAQSLADQLKKPPQ